MLRLRCPGPRAHGSCADRGLDRSAHGPYRAGKSHYRSLLASVSSREPGDGHGAGLPARRRPARGPACSAWTGVRRAGPVERAGRRGVRPQPAVRRPGAGPVCGLRSASGVVAWAGDRHVEVADNPGCPMGAGSRRRARPAEPGLPSGAARRRGTGGAVHAEPFTGAGVKDRRRGRRVVADGSNAAEAVRIGDRGHQVVVAAGPSSAPGRHGAAGGRVRIGSGERDRNIQRPLN